MRSCPCLFLLALFAAAVSAFGADNTIAIWSDDHISTLSDEELMRYALVSPSAAYPEAAQKAKLSGSGLYELHINRAGTTTAVRIVKSSKSPVLDGAARSAFLKWRFKPGVFRSLRVPVTWSVNRVR